jgi:phage-related protein
MLLEYYVMKDRNVPVLQWLRRLPEKDQGRALRYLDLLSLQGLDARRPLVVPLGHPLYELRWPANGEEHRVMYLYVKAHPKFVLLHGYITEKQKTTPPQERATALRRMYEYEEGA